MVAARIVGHILVAEDEARLASVLVQHLAALGHRVMSVADGRAALMALRAEAFDVALVDINMPPPDGLEVLRALSDDPDPPAVVITTGQGKIDTAVQAMRLGAFAYLAKPYRMAELDVVIGRALENRVLAHENATLRAQVARSEGAPEFLTQYAPLHAVFSVAIAAAARETPMLIVGAAGTGKCSLARALHARSPRAARPFTQLDAATLAGDDAERALFGAERTPVNAEVQAALSTRGTLYLHDVLALPARVQVRLARALRDGKFRPANAIADRVVRARVIAGAVDVLDAPGSGAHPDLVVALSAARVVLPPLRDRTVDIPLLARSFIGAAGHATSIRLDPDALAAMLQYPWPGNVAELRAVVERARLLARDGVIRVTDLALNGSDDTLELAEVERRHIASVLESKGWHQGHAAESLGISPKTLYRKIREFGLRRPSVGVRA
jgi:DNA-binding NtrC family response regulator